jgi:hypothetical protein
MIFGVIALNTKKYVPAGVKDPFDAMINISCV